MTPVFLPGKSEGQRSLVGYSSWGHKELDTIEQLNNNKEGMAYISFMEGQAKCTDGRLRTHILGRQVKGKPFRSVK